MPNLVKSTTLIVRDAGRSPRFCRDLLGLSVRYDDESELSGRCLAAGSPGDGTRLAIMKALDPVVGMIGLLQCVEPPLPEPPTRREQLGIVEGLLVMQSDDLEGACRSLPGWGAGVHAAPHRFEVRGADGTVATRRTIRLGDPDGDLLELSQRHAPGGAT